MLSREFESEPARRTKETLYFPLSANIEDSELDYLYELLTEKKVQYYQNPARSDT